VELGKASCSSDQQRQALQSSAGDGETVSGTTSREEVRRAVRLLTDPNNPFPLVLSNILLHVSLLLL
jgi:hypothetical protein